MGVCPCPCVCVCSPGSKLNWSYMLFQTLQHTNLQSLPGHFGMAQLTVCHGISTLPDFREGTIKGGSSQIFPISFSCSMGIWGHPDDPTAPKLVVPPPWQRLPIFPHAYWEDRLSVNLWLPSGSVTFSLLSILPRAHGYFSQEMCT